MSREKQTEQSLDMKVAKLRNGTVIDHLSPGAALKVIDLLGIVDGHILSIGMFLESAKHGRKDIVKIENRILDPDELAKLAILSPGATVCVIQDYHVKEKQRVKLPHVASDIIKCNNPKCITNHEIVSTRFNVEAEEPLKVRCAYCERAMAGSEIVFN